MELTKVDSAIRDSLQKIASSKTIFWSLETVSALDGPLWGGVFFGSKGKFLKNVWECNSILLYDNINRRYLAKENAGLLSGSVLKFFADGISKCALLK